MNIKKPLLIAGIASGIALAGVGVASAATTPTDTSTNLVDKIAQKFNLKKTDVQAVFDENRAAHQAEHQQKMEERLTKAVTDGKITADQKAKILAKQAEMKTFMDSLKDKTAAERKTAMEAKRTELQKWATDNSIPAQFAHPAFEHGGRGGHGMGHRDMGDIDKEATSPTDQ